MASSGVTSVGAGMVLGGRYVVEERVGAGAMGVVWKAWDRRLRRRVAVKKLCDPHDDPRAPREARLAARVIHPRAIAVYDVVEHDNEPWLVMEYLPSRSLAAVLAEHGPLAPGMVAHIGAQLAEALCAVHDAGIVHGDVKPGNVLLTDRGVAKLTDFGGSRASWELTGDSGVVATPDYLAPEVARGNDPSPASDVFSLGATLYAALENEPVCGRLHDVPTVLLALSRGRLRPPTRAGILRGPLTAMLHADAARRPRAATVHRILEGHAVLEPLPVRTKGTHVDPTLHDAEPGGASDQPVAEDSTSPAERVSFDIVFRGYDRAQVQARIRELHEAVESDRRDAHHAQEQLAEIQARLVELRTSGESATSDDPTVSPPGAAGLGTRAETVLRFAAQQADEIRESAQREADARRERARADAAAHRRQVEDDLQERAEELDRLVAARRAVLGRREHDLDEALAARTAEAEQVRQAAEQDAGTRRAEAEQRAREILQAAERSAAHTRAEVEEKHDQHATVHEQVRHHLEALHRLLGDVLTGASDLRADLPSSSTGHSLAESAEDNDSAEDNNTERSARDNPVAVTV